MLVTRRYPFDPFSVSHRALPGYLTLRQMAMQMDLAPEFWEGQGLISVDGMVAEDWDVQPDGESVQLLIRPMGGGGDDGGKNPLAIVASLAVLAATGFVASGGFRALGTAFAQGGIGANLAAAGVALAGQALIAGLSPSPGQQGASQIEASRTSSVASADGNQAAPNGPIPRVLGTHKVFPPFACEPFVYYDGPDEVVEAVYVLAGPHDLQDIKIDSTLADDLQGVAIQTWEGWPGKPQIEIVDRYARTIDVRSEIQGHTLLEDGETVDLEAVNGFLPQPTVVATKESPDEVWIGLSWPQGLNQNGNDNVALRIPMRLRVRNQDGGDWINLPEVHYAAASLTELRGTIRLLFSDDGPSEGAAATSEGFVEIRRASPGQTLEPASADFAADPAFGTTGDDYLTSNNGATSGVQNVVANRYQCDIYLPSATFPKGRYEIEITRGTALINSNWNASDYEYSNVVWDLFGTQGSSSLRIAQDQKSLYAATFMVRSSSVWNETPVQGSDLAVIAIRSTRQLGPLSLVASGYVPKLDGTGCEITSNPAPHLRDIIAGNLNADPVPARIIDEAELLAWEAHCTTEGYTINTIIEDATVATASLLTAFAGYGLPRQARTWGVVSGRDRSAETPMLTLTPRNSSGFSFSKEFGNFDDGIVATFRDRDRDYEERQITEPPEAIGGKLRQEVYDALVTEEDVRKRARFDLASDRKQGASYTVNAFVEALIVQRGDLVGIEHDVLSQETGRAKVVSFTESNGDLTTITLDDVVTVKDEPDIFSVTDFFAVEDVFALGQQWSVMIRPADGGVEVHDLSNATGETNVLTLADPTPSAAIHTDALVTVGPKGQEYGRFILAAVEPQDQETARLTFVDEAPEIWAA